MAIQNVVVAGGTGDLGTPVVQALVQAGFTVTVFSREGSTSKAPEGATVKHVDYKSTDALQAALAGQDAVVSTLTSFAIADQLPLVEAAAAAGIKRFVPSEFGVNTRKTPGSFLGNLLSVKTQVVDRLVELNKANPAFTWTGVSNGHFFDWGLAHGVFGIDLDNKTGTVYDSGANRFGVSNLAFVGRAIAALLKAADTPADKTANKYIEIASFVTSLNEIHATVAKITGTPLAVVRADSAALQKDAEERIAKHDYSAFVPLLNVWQYADGANHAPDVASPEFGNTLLGLEFEDIETAVKAWLKK